ncbi:MAG: TonB-dependent receptor [Sandarakinorhabdus sp.]|nr:TonB-dependent receptor [Sandarakinorhabdus sp.]
MRLCHSSPGRPIAAVQPEQLLQRHRREFPARLAAVQCRGLFPLPRIDPCRQCPGRCGRPVGSLAAFLAANNGYAAIVYPDSFTVKERVIGGYVQADFSSELAGLPVSGNFGVRYTHTRVRSLGSQQQLLDLRTIANDSTAYTGVFSQTAVPITQTTTYDNFLPSFNVKMDFTDRLIGRFAASQTVTRPDLSLLAPRVSFTNLRPGNLQASGGNPDLKPYKSTNFDLTGEWYYQPGGYLTVSGFYKRVEDFVGSSLATEIFTIANADNIFPNGAAPFNVQRPRNLGTIDVYGVEVGFQHNLTWLPAPFDGLGVTANATFVGNSTATTATGTTLALEGLGNSQNAVLFYEKGALQARLAYNHRNQFIQTLANGTGGQPVYFEAYGQLDASASYAVTSYATLFVEGVNVTNAKTRTRGPFENQFLSIVDTGARYAVGARFNF